MAEKTSIKLALNTQDLADEFFEETRLLGIMAPISNYRFCWLLNSALGLDFRDNLEIEIQLMRKNRQYHFSVYDYAEETGSLCHYIYDNSHDGEYLLPELKHFDFLWLMKGDYVNNEYLQQHIQFLRQINGIQLVSELTNEKIRNKENLIF